MADNRVDKNLSSENFEFVQAESKIYDKKFETKPIGYFKDAMIRFRKNKTNVVATAILFTIIALTVIIPLISTKNFTTLESELAFLPPRVPVLANMGILDGTSNKDNIPADLNGEIKSEYDEENKVYVVSQFMTSPLGEDGIAGNADDDVAYWVELDSETLREVNVEFESLLLPTDYPAPVVDLNTLINYEEECTTNNVLCQGGQSVLSVDAGKTHVYLESVDFFTLSKSSNGVIEVVVTDFVNESGSAVLNVMVQPVFAGDWETIATITNKGTYAINVFDEVSALFNITSKVRFELVSSTKDDKVMLESVSYYDDGSELDENNKVIPEKIDEGFALSSYVINTEDESAGLYVRQNGHIIMTDFKYLNYVAALGEQDRVGFPSSEFDEIVAANADCKPIGVANPTEPEDYVGMYPETCPLIEVRKVNDGVEVDGVLYFSYDLTLNYQQYKGYEEMPYFYFGTDFNGRDLFTLLWVATRTSLLIGVVVAAINVSVGIVYGAIAGYYGGTTDIILQRFAEIIGRIPWLVTLSIFVSFFGPGIQTLVLILIVSGWIGPQAVTRTQFYRYKGREYVLASRTLGAKDSRLIFRHILPNGIGTIITSSILMIPYTIFSESTISYLGFGVGHGQEFELFGIRFSGVSVGVLLSDGRNYLLDRPYLTIFPSLLISVLMITFNMFGNALRDAFNPALRGSE